MPDNIHCRKVTRVLVMLEYEPGDPDNGEVFDLTQLVEEVRTKNPQNNYSGDIHLNVYSHKTYLPQGQPQSELNVSWSTNFSTSAARLEDAINSGMPDGERVTNIRKRIARHRKKADDLEMEAKVEKLRQVGAIRTQHPIARITASPLSEGITAALPSSSGQ